MDEPIFHQTAVCFDVALAERDAPRLAALYADDVRLLAPSAELIHDRAGVEAFWRAGIEAGLRRVDRSPSFVRRDDGLAYEVGRYALLVGVGEAPLVERGNYVLIHARQSGGDWRWAVEMFSPDEPASTHSAEGGGGR